MQTTLLGLAIAFILALVAALVGPLFVDWNQFRPQFEAEATRVLGAPVRVSGGLDARLLPSPSLSLRQVMVGGANDLGKIHAEQLEVEFSLGALLRGEGRATELTVNGLALDTGFDARGRIDLPAFSGRINPGLTSIDRLNVAGRIVLHDAASRTALELNDIIFRGDVRSLAGSLRGEGSFIWEGARHPFRISSAPVPDDGGTRLRLAVDAGERPVSADLDGVVSFSDRMPRFDGAITLASVAAKSRDKERTRSAETWKLQTRIKADPTGGQLEQLDGTFGAEDRGLRLAGSGEVRFGAAPRLRLSLAARQFDADRFLGRDADPAQRGGVKSPSNAEPVQALQLLRQLRAAIPVPPLPTEVELASEQITLGGRPLQNVAAVLLGDSGGWRISRADLRAPGGTRLVVRSAPVGGSDEFAGAVELESGDPDLLAGWLQGRTDIPLRNQKPLRIRGQLRAGPGLINMQNLKAEVDGSPVEGQFALTYPTASTSKLETSLKADRLDLDAAVAYLRALAGPSAEWPDEAQVALEIGTAISASQELRKFNTRFSYGPRAVALDQLKFGQGGAVSVEASGYFDRSEATGRMTLVADAMALSQFSNWIAPFSPLVAARINAMGVPAGVAHLKLGVDIGKAPNAADRASMRGTLDLDAPQFKGSISIGGKPKLASLRGMTLTGVDGNELSLTAKLSADRVGALVALLGLDQIGTGGEGAGQFDGTLTGEWGKPLRIDAKLWGNGIDAQTQGVIEPWETTPKADLNLKIRSVNLAPLFGLKPAEARLQGIRIFGHATLDENKLLLDDLDSVASGARLRGRLALTLGDERRLDGNVALESLDLPPLFAVLIGGSGRGATEPLGAGLAKNLRGRIEFQATRASLSPDIEFRPLAGVIRSDGQAVLLEGFKGVIGKGEMTAAVDARPGENGVGINATIELNKVDGSALRYRGLKMPAGQTALKMSLTAQGRSVAALTGALSGSGTVRLQGAVISGLEPRVFDVATQASDSGQATDDVRLRQIVDPVLSSGALLVPAAEIPFTIRDGRLRVGPATLEAEGAKAVVSGGYDIAADQADLRASLSRTAAGTGNPEISLFLAGPPQSLSRTLDVAPLSSWLAVRAIERETRRLDSLQRGEPPQAAAPFAPPAPVAPPPSTAALPGPAVEPPAEPAPPATTDVRLPVPDPRRPVKPRLAAPQPLPEPPTASVDTPPATAPALPPPVEIKPAPGPVVLPRPRPAIAPSRP